MKVIIMKEDAEGFLGIAKDYKTAVKYLCQMGWLDKNFEFWVYEKKWRVTTILDRLGSNWFNIISSWTIGQFNEYFEGTFVFREEEVWEDKKDDN